VYCLTAENFRDALGGYLESYKASKVTRDASHKERLAFLKEQHRRAKELFDPPTASEKKDEIINARADARKESMRQDRHAILPGGVPIPDWKARLSIYGNN
jgi:hypothetical protein